jgi:hypothetical protein
VHVRLAYAQYIVDCRQRDKQVLAERVCMKHTDAYELIYRRQEISARLSISLIKIEESRKDAD